MIRWLAPALLAALPAAAQDFRGLRPGDPASALGAIGEPLWQDRDDGLTMSAYPLPFEQRLDVIYDADGTIVWLNSAAMVGAPAVPDPDGLAVGEMTLADVERFLGRARASLDTPGLRSPLASGAAFELIYDLTEDPDVLVLLRFVEPAEAVLLGIEDADGPVFIAAALVLRSFFEASSDLRSFDGGPRAAPIPFPISIDEAFPSLIP